MRQLILRGKKNLRLLAVGSAPAAKGFELDFRKISGGLVAMAKDATAAGEVKG